MAVGVAPGYGHEAVTAAQPPRVVAEPGDFGVGVGALEHVHVLEELREPHGRGHDRSMVGSTGMLRIGARELVLGQRTYVMAVVNVSPDSFSGDGISDVSQAVERGRQAEAEGADIVDVGGESTRPETWGRPPLPVEAELARVVPVVERLREAVAIPISIDTSKAVVARTALGAGAAMVNDVTGLKGDPDMADEGAGD